MLMRGCLDRGRELGKGGFKLVLIRMGMSDENLPKVTRQPVESPY